MTNIDFRARGLAAAIVFSVLSTSCIPYAVGTTAEPVPRGQRARTLITTVMPPVMFDSTRGQAALSTDGEIRRGIDSVSDFGMRLVGGSGFVMSYKRLFTRRDEPALISVIPAAGVVNFGDHAYFDLTVVASARTRRPGGATAEPRLVPYGGLRAMHVLPLHEGAVWDQPTLGGFLGLRIGTLDFGVSPEIGVFHDPSALGVRDNPVVIVPSISLHGDLLIEMWRSIPRGRR